MLPLYQVRLNIVRAYINYITELYPNEEDGADRLLLVLRIYRWHLGRSGIHRPLSFDHLQMAKTGVRQAELILQDIQENEPELMNGWYAGCPASNQGQHLANLLCELILEFTQTIIANENLFPELKQAFDRERAEYRRMKHEAEKAESLK